MKKLLIFTDYYIPGYKGGGPIKSLSLLAKELSERFEIYIVTRDRDLGDSEPYKNIKSGIWTKKDRVNIYYSNNDFSILNIKKIIQQVNPGVIYLNSFFSTLTLMVLMASNMKKVNSDIILAPRGELSQGALSIKSIKKNTYIKMFKLMRLHQSIHFHTTSKEETNSVKLIFSSNQIFEINNLSAIHFSESIAFKRENELNLYFISRISRKKNLHYALEILREVETDGLINFKVIGPHEDEEYIKECKKIIEKLPENINVFFEGPIPPADISQAILNDHFFLFPTLGENFGHVISEAIMVNKPVILSNTTPWSDVIKKFELGYILRLENKEKWISLLENLVKLNNAEYKMYLNSFNNYKVNSAISNKNIVQKHCSMFEDIGN